VYLDLNHYILLARTAVGTKAPAGYTQLLEACRTAHDNDRAVFPLSGTHYIEMSRIADPRQRRDVAEVMEQLSDYTVLLGRSTLAELEIDAALDTFLGLSSSEPRCPLLGRSCGWAFGFKGGLIVTNAEGNDVTSQARAQIGDERFDDMNRQREWAFLAGPEDADLPALRARGYAPETTFEVAERRAEEQRKQAERLDEDPNWRQGRLRDLVSAKEVTQEVIDILTRVLLRRSMSMGAILTGTKVENRDRIRAFSDGMPSCRVAISLKTAYHRDAHHRWTANDIHDIDALAVALPYCDAVFTDKAARNAVAAAKELRPFDTFLPRRPPELVDWLSLHSLP
jgi:hypothetical protein